jgi:lipid-binding SYLF domain-containing protein
MHAEILSYSRSRGVFAGVSLEGATLRPDHDANLRIYSKEVEPKQILRGEIPAPESTRNLLATLSKYSSAKH